MVVATLALVLALAGTGVAARTYLISSGKQIKDGAVSGADVRNSSLTGADVKDRSLTARDIRGGLLAGPAGAPGPAGPPGPTGAKGDSGDPGLVRIAHRIARPFVMGTGPPTEVLQEVAGKLRLKVACQGTITPSAHVSIESLSGPVDWAMNGGANASTPTVAAGTEPSQVTSVISGGSSWQMHLAADGWQAWLTAMDVEASPGCRISILGWVTS